MTVRLATLSGRVLHAPTHVARLKKYVERQLDERQLSDTELEELHRRVEVDNPPEQDREQPEKQGKKVTDHIPPASGIEVTTTPKAIDNMSPTHNTEATATQNTDNSGTRTTKPPDREENGQQSTSELDKPAIPQQRPHEQDTTTDGENKRTQSATAGLTESDDTGQDGISTERYTIKQILLARHRRGRKEYLVEWEGYEKPTWEPATLIESDSPEAVTDYYERNDLVCRECGYKAYNGHNYANHQRIHRGPALRRAPETMLEESDDESG